MKTVYVIVGVAAAVASIVVDILSSEEWKRGSFGTKIEKAVTYKRAGVPLVVVREDRWTEAIRAQRG